MKVIKPIAALWLLLALPFVTLYGGGLGPVPTGTDPAFNSVTAPSLMSPPGTPLLLGGNNGAITLQTNGFDRWGIQINNWVPLADNAYDLGRVGQRVKSGYFYALDTLGGGNVLHMLATKPTATTPVSPNDAYIDSATGRLVYYAGAAAAPSGSTNYAPINAASVTTLTAATTLPASGGTYLCNASAGGFTATLPDATTCKGQEFFIKKIDTNCSNSIIVATTGGQTIDGSATNSLAVPYLSNMYQSDGTNWFRPNVVPGTRLKIFSSIATKTTSNTASTFSLVPTGSATSSMTRAPSYLAVGRSIFFEGGGVFSVPAGASLSFSVTINGTVIASGTMANGGLGANALTNVGWDATKIQFETLTTGTTGTVIATGSVNVNGTVLHLSTTTPVTIDTTVTPVFDFRAQFDAASSTRTITTNAFVMSGAL